MNNILLLLLVAILFVSSTAFVSVGRAFLYKHETALNGIKVTVGEDEPIENAIKKFKRNVNQSGHLMELRFKEQWETVAEKKKRKSMRNRQLNRIERTNQRYENRAYGGSEYNS